jgi:hypothetical protein
MFYSLGTKQKENEIKKLPFSGYICGFWQTSVNAIKLLFVHELPDK